MKSAPDIETIFAEAIEIASPEARLEYLDRACASKPALRQQAEKLVADHFRAGDFLEGSAPVPNAPPPGPQIGQSIERYRLIEQIGEGGMGVVFVAEQTSPVRRRVALKVIKAGLDTRQAIARFEAERQTLALMDHPHIARIFDGGSTEQGRSYFVMELVKGIPITTYCQEAQLDLVERLKLFVTICQAVQHAHQKGIIHRDLKPSNVLVTVLDGEPIVKVIDFGIAKILHQTPGETAIVTGFSQIVGTPLYMSPEQAALSAVDVDTRSDIYSLGVLLYELLTGTTPFDKEQLSQVGLDEFRRIIREDEPPRPSSRISTVGLGGSTVASPSTRPRHALSRSMRNELDWIVMKALEKERARRYQSTSDLAQDVERYLRGDAIEACPPSRVYRLGKYVRKHRLALGATALIAAALVAGTTISLWQAREAQLARQKADSRYQYAETQRKRAEAEEERAKAEEARAKASFDRARRTVTDLMARVLNEDVVQTPGLEQVYVNLRQDVLAAYADLIKLNPADATVHADLGDFHLLHYEYGEALKCFERAAVLEPDNARHHQGIAGILTSNGGSRIGYRPGSNDLEEFDLKQTRALKHAERALELDPGNVTCRVYRALAISALGRRDEAGKLFKEIEAQFELSALHYRLLAEWYRNTSSKEAQRCVRKSIELDPESAEAFLLLGQMLSMRRGDPTEALAALRESSRLDRRVLRSPDRHRRVETRCRLCFQHGLLDEAAEALQELDLDVRTAPGFFSSAIHNFGRDDPRALRVLLVPLNKTLERSSDPTLLLMRAYVYRKLVMPAEERVDLEKAVAVWDTWRDWKGRPNSDHKARVGAYLRLGDFSQALVYVDRFIESNPEANDIGISREDFGRYQDDGFRAEIIKRLSARIEAAPRWELYEERAKLYQLMGQHKLALADRQSVLRQMRVAEEGHYRFALAYFMTAQAALLANDRATYQVVSREMVARMRQLLGPTPPLVDYHSSQLTLWTAVLGPGAVEKPEELSALVAWASHARPRTLSADTLGAVHLRQGNYQEAKQTLETFVKNQPPTAEPITTLYLLAMAEHHLGMEDGARAWLLKAREYRDIKRDQEIAKHGSLVYWDKTLDILDAEAGALIAPKTDSQD